MTERLRQTALQKETPLSLEEVEIVPRFPELEGPPLRILLNGQGPFAAEVFDALIADERIITGAILVRKPDDPLRKKVEEENRVRAQDGVEEIAIFNLRDVNEEETQKQMKNLGADLGVMAFVTRTIPNEVLSAAELGTIEFHPSFLPDGRGRSAINYAILKGKEEIGASVFWVDEGLDTGPLLLQFQSNLSDSDTAGDYYRDVLSPLGVILVRDAVRIVAYQGENSPKEKQDEKFAEYDPPFTKEVGRIDWTKSADEIARLCRAAQKTPGAWISLDEVGEKIANFFDVRWEDIEGDFIPGQIVSVDANSGEVYVASSKGLIIVGTIQEGVLGRDKKGDLLEISRSKARPAADFVNNNGIKQGTIFVSGSSNK